MKPEENGFGVSHVSQREKDAVTSSEDEDGGKAQEKLKCK